MEQRHCLPPRTSFNPVLWKPIGCYTHPTAPPETFDMRSLRVHASPQHSDTSTKVTFPLDAHLWQPGVISADGAVGCGTHCAARLVGRAGPLFPPWPGPAVLWPEFYSGVRTPSIVFRSPKRNFGNNGPAPAGTMLEPTVVLSYNNSCCGSG